MERRIPACLQFPFYGCFDFQFPLKAIQYVATDGAMLAPRSRAYLLGFLDRASDKQRCPVWIHGEMISIDITDIKILYLDARQSYIWPGETLMQGQTGERWRQLCEQAAAEKDPQRLLELAREITRLLGEKEERLKEQRENSAA